MLAQLSVCALEYGCFTAQNVFLGAGEAALPVSPACNARCVGCISDLDEDAGFPSPQTRIAYEATAAEVARIAVAHLAGEPGAIVSFGQGCEGEPLLRATTIARAIELIRAAGAGGVVNCNTNGSLPRSLTMLIDAGLDAVRISLNSFRPEVYAAYYGRAATPSKRSSRASALALAGGLARLPEPADASRRDRRARRDPRDGAVPGWVLV